MNRSSRVKFSFFRRFNLPFVYKSLKKLRELYKGIKTAHFESFDLKEIERFSGTNNPIIMDIGSNDGEEILEFLELYPGCRIYAIEADPESFKRLQNRFDQDSRVKCFNLAIADINGTINFNCSSGFAKKEQRRTNTQHDYSGSILKPKLHLKIHPNVKFEKKIEVNCMTLDSFIVSHNLLAPDFLWIDVQGAEYNVLRGGIETLKKTKAIYTEYSLKELYEGQKDLWFISNYLKDAGFKLEKRFKDDALFCRSEPFPFA